jgi:hypothetical protein
MGSASLGEARGDANVGFGRFMRIDSFVKQLQVDGRRFCQSPVFKKPVLKKYWE